MDSVVDCARVCLSDYPGLEVLSLCSEKVSCVLLYGWSLLKLLLNCHWNLHQVSSTADLFISQPI